MIQCLLGTGGMGEVYRAVDTRLQRAVAIKILPAHLSSDSQLHSRFLREAQLISALHHPNICAVYDIGSQDGIDFMVMEYLAGRTLDKLIPPDGLSVDLSFKYALQIADGLSSAHAAGVVHRDLKPANIMVEEGGVVKVLDFGVAKLDPPARAASDEVGTSLTNPGAIVGTAAYMSPEQAKGEPTTTRSDIFSFGSVLYELLCGTRAFPDQTTVAVIRDEPRPLIEMRRDIPPQVRDIVACCLKKDPAVRYASGSELAHELRVCLNLLSSEQSPALSRASIVREVRRPRVWVPVTITVIILAIAASWLLKRFQDARWAREVAIPEIARLADAEMFPQAYSLAVRAERLTPNDSALVKQWPRISYAMSLETAPSGAQVFRRNYVDPTGPWEFVGTTPLKSLRQPRGMFIWKFEKQGFSTALRTTGSLVPRSFGAPLSVEGQVSLDAVGDTPPGMVRVSAQKFFTGLYIPGYEGLPRLEIKDYWIDQYEVTNRQFKTFLDQGGYQRREYWKVDFEQDGKHLPWEEAMARFRDAAGRPGPKNWIQGRYPKGQDDFPVTGISWYEAAAYAEFVGKSLPTLFHWNRAAGPTMASFLVPASNFGSTGPLPVGSKQGMSPWGSYDMAGNVKEWIWNEAGSGKRYVFGGAWNEPNYMFIDPDAQSPFLRTSNVGFRCAKYPEPHSIPKAATDPVPSPRRDLANQKPSSDGLFEVYRGLYSYDRLPLNATVETFGKEDEDWKVEKVTYTAAYNNERATAYLFLPKKFAPPYQTVIVFPGSNALVERTFSMDTMPALDVILRSGRAVLYPVYKGTFERGDGMESDSANMSSTWRDHVIMWVKDVSRSIDYARTRTELDQTRLAYFGLSWGAAMGAFVPALEPRIKACILVAGGLNFQDARAEVDAINFLPRVKQPVLMLNGRYDFFFPLKSSQEPFFRGLGSVKGQNKQLVYETGHFVPVNELTKEMLSWLDLYLGPVN